MMVCLEMTRSTFKRAFFTKIMVNIGWRLDIHQMSSVLMKKDKGRECGLVRFDVVKIFYKEEVKVHIVVRVILIVLIVLLAALIALYFLGRKAQKKQVAQKQQLEAMKQNVSMLVIDKKRMKLKDAGLPAQVLEQTPKLMRNTKLPIVKAKIGPRVMSLICDAKIFDQVPIKKEVKAVVSGIYITSVRGIRGPLEQAPEKKKGLLSKIRNKAEAQLEAESASKKKK